MQVRTAVSTLGRAPGSASRKSPITVSLFKSCFVIFELTDSHCSSHSACPTVLQGKGGSGVPASGDGVQSGCAHMGAGT